MSSLDDLYKEVILDHYRNPRNRGTLESPTISHDGNNPLCGDTVTLQIETDGERIKDVRFEGTGCSISQSSISMMTGKIKEMTLEDTALLIERFHAIMRGEDDGEEDLGELDALRGVTKFPARIKCALLGWDTLKGALRELEDSG